MNTNPMRRAIVPPHQLNDSMEYDSEHRMPMVSA
jgi:hypothetical protein